MIGATCLGSDETAAAVERFLESRTAATTRSGGRVIPRTRLETLFTDPAHALRERVLWRLLYDTAARAAEILTLNVEDLDLEFRRARVTSKGGVGVAELGEQLNSLESSPDFPSPGLRAGDQAASSTGCSPGVGGRQARRRRPGDGSVPGRLRAHVVAYFPI